MRLHSREDLAVQSFPTLPTVARPALLVVDMQNDFVRAGAPFEVPTARETIPPQQHLLEAFRAQGLPVVFLKWIGIENDPYRWMQDKFTWARGLAEDIRGCRPGHPRHYADINAIRDCCAVIDELAPAAGEIQLTKRGYGGFLGTTLDAILRDREVDGVVITGVMAECCVEDTARQAYQLHYPAVVVTDGVATYDPKATATMLDVVDKNFGWVAEAKAVIKWLRSLRC
ncbi:cysteine hydrolase [Sinorhizobium meliloti]|uniref:cysteine hydrolase family protein n=1 Tax=Rhizobium meliloti TaxID=382 RepID=UPI000FD82161|nr:isochorismatase family cysteine hydrolase [Sinorhizobium meliloti]RVM41535.1 cysteine hydrolase [Sinorhizobium meliloti]RVN59162.1 cysteine hydrolase [Sinorhizobium meliloti]RVO29094.1 cysteine hydrolase [Sinorhizobium meliloti]RVP53780.1 cysteine hydrolase [Sinorhizobium meliloti]